MDKYSKRLLRLATQILSECELDDATEQEELRAILQRLLELAAGVADEMCCDKINQEIRDMKREGRAHGPL